MCVLVICRVGWSWSLSTKIGYGRLMVRVSVGSGLGTWIVLHVDHNGLPSGHAKQ